MVDFTDRTVVVVDVELLAAPAGRASPALPAGEQLLQANLYAVCDLVAGRAARASSARQYLTIYTRFCDALRDELGRPPAVADVTADAIAAYSRALEHHGGRGGGPASPATRRAHITMLRALLTQLGRDSEAANVRVPSHRVGPPETLSAVQYGNLIRAPDRRTALGKRDHALLRMMGDCGLRNAELRALTIQAIRRPRANSAHHHLFVRGKGDVEREIPIPAATHTALEIWLRAHPHGSALAFATRTSSSRASHVTAAAARYPSRPWPSWCAATPRWQESHSAWRTRTRCAATTPQRSPTRTSRSRRSRPGSDTHRSRRPPATSQNSPTAASALAMSWTAITKHSAGDDLKRRVHRPARNRDRADPGPAGRWDLTSPRAFPTPTQSEVAPLVELLSHQPSVEHCPAFVERWTPRPCGNPGLHPRVRPI